MKEYTIYDIEALTENNAAALAQEKLDIKGHTVYLVDFRGTKKSVLGRKKRIFEGCGLLKNILDLVSK